MKWALALVGLCAGCSLAFDDSTRYLPLVGSPPATGLQLIDAPRGHTLQFVTGPDGVAWAALYDPAAPAHVRAVRLAEPVREVTYQSAATLVARHHLYLSDGTSLYAVNPGDDATSGKVPLPPFAGNLLPNDEDTAFLYLGDAAFAVYRSDLAQPRVFTLTPPVLAHGRSPLLTSNGELVFTFEPDGTVMAHAVRSARAFAIGSWAHGAPAALVAIADDSTRSVVFCDPRGLVALSYDAALPRIIDSRCTVLIGDSLPRIDRALVYYRADAATTKVAPLDGSAPPRVVPAGVRIWALGESLAYSLDPAGRYVGDAGDGWIGDWRFMRRGLGVQLGAVAPAVRWIEASADDNRAGDLTLAPHLGAPPRPLARNVTQFDELADGRVIAEANRAYDHQANRVIVIDAGSLEARWVADGVRRYLLIPGGDELLGELVGEGDLRLARFAIPGSR